MGDETEGEAPPAEGEGGDVPAVEEAASEGDPTLRIRNAYELLKFRISCLFGGAGGAREESGRGSMFPGHMGCSDALRAVRTGDTINMQCDPSASFSSLCPIAFPHTPILQRNQVSTSWPLPSTSLHTDRF